MSEKKECQEQNHRTYGYRRVQIWRERQGIYRNPKTVLRVMQKYNLLSVFAEKSFIITVKICTDTPIRLIVIFLLTDQIKNGLLIYHTSKEQSIKLVLDTIKAAKRKEEVTVELQLHSDQGYINFYNNYSIQTKTKLTPLEKRNQFVA